MTAAHRVGMLTPSSNTVLEPVTARLVAPLAGLVTVHFSRFPVSVISDDDASHRQFEPEPMLRAAGLLADARVDVIVWNGTSGAWEGLDRDRDLCRAVTARTGVACTTATLSLLKLTANAGIHRCGLVVPYVDTITERIRATLRAEGLECVGVTNERVTTNFEFAEIEPETLAERVRTVAPAADAVIIHCTNLRGAEVAGPLAAELHIPIFDSVVVALWGALEMLGIPAALPGLGRLPRPAGDRRGD